MLLFLSVVVGLLPCSAIRIGLAPSGGCLSEECGLKPNGAAYCANCLWTDDRFCNWDETEGVCRGYQCYYPTGDYEKRFPEAAGMQRGLKTGTPGIYTARKGQWTADSGAPGFGFDAAACRAQGATYSRFNGMSLALDPTQFSPRCIEAYYAAAQNPWGDNIQTTAEATNEQIAALSGACEGEADKLSTGNTSIVLIVANTPRKESLYRWINGMIASAPSGNCFLAKYSLSGTGTTLGALKSKFPALAKDFVPVVPGMRPQSGPMGGDAQGGILMALEKAKGAFFWHSYKTECHRCDISAYVQICNAMKTRKVIECAYNDSEADQMGGALQ